MICPYAVFNIRKDCYEPRYKYIRNEKNVNMKKFVENFQQLPLNLVYSFDDPDDQISLLNKLVTDCINEHAPVRRVKITRPVAPWMNNINVIRM